MLVLRRPRPVRRNGRQHVAVEQRHALEASADRARARKAGESGADHDRVFAERRAHSVALRERRIGEALRHHVLARRHDYARRVGLGAYAGGPGGTDYFIKRRHVVPLQMLLERIGNRTHPK